MGLRSFSRIIALWICLAGPSYGQSWQSLDAVKSDAHNYLHANLSTRFPEQKIGISVNAIDNRLRLAHCDKPLTFQLHDQSLRASNVTLKAQCDGSTTWSFYLTAKVDRRGKVLVARRDLARHEQIQEPDLKLEYRKLRGSSSASLSSFSSAVGQQLKRAIRAGDLVTGSNLEAPRVVAKGDQVTVTAVSNGISVATAGTAMNNGKVGEQIRVQNNHTDRIIKARITAPGRVQVVL